MPTPIYAWFHGKSQGDINGWGSWPGVDDQGGPFEGSSLIYQLEHEITSPRDPQSGLATGQRVHHPIRIVKRIDKASPLLYKALCENEELDEVIFQWWRSKKVGGFEHYFTTKLVDANIVSMKEWFPITIDPAKEQFVHLEDIAFTYNEIRWVWEIDGIETMDSWKERA